MVNTFSFVSVKFSNYNNFLDTISVLQQSKDYVNLNPVKFDNINNDINNSNNPDDLGVTQNGNLHFFK